MNDKKSDDARKGYQGEAIDVGQKAGYIGYLGKLFGRKKKDKKEK